MEDGFRSQCNQNAVTNCDMDWPERGIGKQRRRFKSFQVERRQRSARRMECAGASNQQRVRLLCIAGIGDGAGNGACLQVDFMKVALLNNVRRTATNSNVASRHFDDPLVRQVDEKVSLAVVMIHLDVTAQFQEHVRKGKDCRTMSVRVFDFSFQCVLIGKE